MLVLGIETSCDETSAAVVEDGKRILSNVVLSSLRFHKPYGGVVPEIAARHHAELIDSVIKAAFLRAGCGIGRIGLIAVTDRPGLIGALLVGLSAAKGLSLSTGIPFLGVDHIKAHLYAPLMGCSRIRFPFVGLVVSGGHTNLVSVEGFDRHQGLGQTTDDAAGEAFDKVAKILGLGYPGGPLIERLARKGDPNSIKFPKSLLEPDSLDFSFSGIKTAVLYYSRRNNKDGRLTADICASFQDSVIDVISQKTIKACQKKRSRTVVVGGGVSLNLRLRDRLTAECKRFNITVHFPPPSLCMDNAAMVAGLGYQLYKKKGPVLQLERPYKTGRFCCAKSKVLFCS
jgi:N6-L-threonylcarbamoyladenine synthase